MRFCPKCEAKLKKGRDELNCPKCGYIESSGTESPAQAPQNLTQALAEGGGGRGTEPDNALDVPDANDDDEVEAMTHPTIEIDCEKCGNDKAVWWMLQTRSADEPTTQFYRCTKCQYTWRDYS